MVRRLLAVCFTAVAGLVLTGGAALACGGLVAPGHAEVLQKATTLVAWHNGFEHYVTGFQFAGTAGSFGYIIPLPGNPTKIQKGGNWTLERLEREINPVKELAFAALADAPASAHVAVLQQVKIDALDITVVRGGGPDVAKWAKANGFDLTTDTPKVLGAYSSKGAVFALARFDRNEAAKRHLVQGQGQVIEFTIPTKAPWVPLRILALGKGRLEAVDADLFALTDHDPQFAPGLEGMPGMQIRQEGPASEQLLADLRSDRAMGWLPTKGMWLTAMTLHTKAWTVNYDLSIDGGGPPLAAGVAAVPGTPGWVWLAIAMLGAVTVGVWLVWRPDRPTLRPA